MKRKIITLFIVLLSLLLCIGIAYSISKYVFKYDFPMQVIVSIDKIAPEIDITDINGSSIRDNETATEYAIISYSDDLSGISKAVYRYNSSKKDFSNSETLTLNNNTKLTNEGWYELEATDRAGNKTVIHICVDWAVARIKQVYYRKLEWAINDVPFNNDGTKTTIYMLRNVSEVNTISANKNVILDIDKTTITRKFHNRKKWIFSC